MQLRVLSPMVAIGTDVDRVTVVQHPIDEGCHTVMLTGLNITNKHLLTDNSLTFGGVH